MKEKIKKIIISIIIIGGLFLFYNFSLAHPGNTASDGCHYCRTNCTSWGVPWNQRHCHGGSSYTPNYSSPLYDSPSYTPSIPSCPFNSYYDSISSSCKCYSGYVVSDGKCISTNQWCQDKYGLWATSDYLTDSCKCSYGYVFGKDILGKTTCISESQYCKNSLGYNSRYNILTDSCECSYSYVLSNGSCVYGNTVCHQKYGYHSNYDSLSEACKCDYGYVFNSADQCVSRDDYCEDLYGYNAEYSLLSSGCVCKDGYELQNNRCTEIIPVIYSFYPAIVRAGESITVSGNNFGDYKGNIILNTLSFGILGRISYLDIKSWDDNQIKFIVSKDKEPDEYYIRIEPSSIFSSKEVVSKNKLKVLMPLPKIYSIYSLEAEIGEEVTISGENFGDSKYDELNLYIGSTKVSSGNITSWWDNKIIFEVTDDLESGYIILKDNNFSNPTVVQGSYLEILELEKDSVFIYPPIVTKETPTTFQQSTIEPELDTKPQPQFEIELEPQLEPQLESQSEPQLTEETESQLQADLQLKSQQESKTNEEPKPETDQEITEEQIEEPKREQKESIWISLASILNNAKNFFFKIFAWF